MSDDPKDEFEKRFRPFAGRFDIDPQPDQIRNEDGTPGDWIAKAYLIENRYDSSLHKAFWPYGFRRFKSEREAGSAALWGTLEWLEEGRPAVRQIAE